MDLQKLATRLDTTEEQLSCLFQDSNLYSKFLQNDSTLLNKLFDSDKPYAKEDFDELFKFYMIHSINQTTSQLVNQSSLDSFDISMYRDKIIQFREVLKQKTSQIKGGMRQFVEGTTDMILERYELKNQVSKNLLIIVRAFIRIMGNYILELSNSEIRSLTIETIYKDMEEITSGINNFIKSKNISQNDLLKDIHDILKHLHKKEWVQSHQFYGFVKSYIEDENGELISFDKLNQMFGEEKGDSSEFFNDIAGLIQDKEKIYKLISKHFIKGAFSHKDEDEIPRPNFKEMSRRDKIRYKIQLHMAELQEKKIEEEQRKNDYQEEIRKREMEKRRRKKQRQKKKKEQV